MAAPPALMRADYPRPGGALRRLISLRGEPDGAAVGWIEDDFHHFGVTIVHDGQRVTDVSAASPRAPWSSCPGAALPLRALIGKPLIARASDIGQLIDMRVQCTHMFDLAGLALAHAYHGRERRSYEAVVPDRRLLSRTGRSFRYEQGRCTLLRDDEIAMEWDVVEPEIVGPPRYAGHSLNRGFRAWTESLPEDEAEQAFVLRRAIMVAAGRTMDLDYFETAEGMSMDGACYTYSLPDAAKVRRNKGSSRNYEGGSEGMLAHRAERP
jgi:hypothetical protein